jgi:hypothetical protein
MFSFHFSDPAVSTVTGPVFRFNSSIKTPKPLLAFVPRKRTLNYLNCDHMIIAMMRRDHASCKLMSKAMTMSRKLPSFGNFWVNNRIIARRRLLTFDLKSS